MSTRLALLKAILAAPDDDLPRLVFADWLEENGTSDADAARAEFIRLGCLSRVKLKITSAETKWIDRNWQRLLVTTISARPKKADPPCVDRDGRFLRLHFDWFEAGRYRRAEIQFEYDRGFVRRVEYSNGHGYQRFWQPAATDEPLAYHRPELRPDVLLSLEHGPSALVTRTAWGDELYSRVIGFDDEVASRKKVYRGVARRAATEAFHPLAVVDEHGLDLPQHRARAAVATAMTARAQEFVGLV